MRIHCHHSNLILSHHPVCSCPPHATLNAPIPPCSQTCHVFHVFQLVLNSAAWTITKNSLILPNYSQHSKSSVMEHIRLTLHIHLPHPLIPSLLPPLSTSLRSRSVCPTSLGSRAFRAFSTFKSRLKDFNEGFYRYSSYSYCVLFVISCATSNSVLSLRRNKTWLLVTICADKVIT